MIWNGKSISLTLLLAGVAALSPIIAYAGVTVVYPKSTHTVNVNASPPITFAQGADYASANANGFASAFTLVDANAAFTITLSALSGGNVTIDKYANLVAGASITSFKMQIATAVSGTLDATEIVVLRIRLWTGGTPPTADNSTGVCAVLNLEALVNTESGTTCGGNQTVFVQVLYELGTGSAGSSTLALRPSSIVFA
jgi:hypothetical protein